VYTGYFNDGSVETFHDFIWSATSIITGKEYNYPCHCRWVWEEDKITTTTCYVDPAAIFEESAIYAESQN
jgi:ketosteroid isomerase-like protein